MYMRERTNINATFEKAKEKTNIKTQKKFQPNVEPVNQLLMRSTPYAYINVEHTASSLLLLIVSCKVCHEN